MTPKVPELGNAEKPECWKEHYPDAKEDIPRDAPEAKMEELKLTFYVDANHANDKISRKSVSGYILMINSAPIIWMSKRQGSVESSTYGENLLHSERPLRR